MSLNKEERESYEARLKWLRDIKIKIKFKCGNWGRNLLRPFLILKL